MWWLTVGWAIPSSSVRSHAHTSAQPRAATCESSRRRMGSASALRSTASSAASSAPSGPSAREQQSSARTGAAAVETGTEQAVMPRSLRLTLTDVDTSG